MNNSTKTILGLTGTALALLLATGNSSADVRRTHKATKPVVAVTPPAPVAAPAPVIPAERLDLHPAVPPQVSFNNGLLTVTAQNATLGDILNAIHVKTGAMIEMSGPILERVAIRIGPAPAREVFTALLDGSRFNYIILGSAANPMGAEHVILTAKTGGATGAVASAQPVYQPPQAQAPPPGPAPQYPPGTLGVVRGQGGIGSPVAPAPDPNAQGAQDPPAEAEAEPEQDQSQEQAADTPEPDPEPDPSPGETPANDQNQHQRGPDGNPPPQAPQGPK